jgi:hypothetical protein
MAHTLSRVFIDKSVTPNIGIDPLLDVSYVQGRATGDYGQVCGDVDENGTRVNKTSVFSMAKPFRNAFPGFSSAAAQLAAAKAANYGTGIVSCGIVDFASMYNQRWTYLPPRGVGGGAGGQDEHYRIEDFDGYQHKSWPTGPGSTGRDLYTIFNGYLHIPGSVVSDNDLIYFNMQCRENEDQDSDLGMLYPYDFQGAAKDFSDYYVGIAILDHNGGVWIISDPQVSDYFSGTNVYTGISVALSASIPNGAVVIVPVLTENRSTSWTNSLQGDIIILDGEYLTATKVAQTGNLQTNVTFTVSGNSVTLNFTMKNQTGNSITINNMVCYLLSEGAYMNEHDNGYSGPDYMGSGAAAYINDTWPFSYKQGDIYSHDWPGGSTNPDQLAARYYNAYSDFYAANGNSNVLGNNTTRTWSKTFNFTDDDFGSYANGAWALLCLAPTGNYFVREYKSY